MLVDEVFSLVKRLNAEGLSILLVEQNVGQALEIAHRAYVLENGAMTFHGTPAELLGNSELKRAYLGI
jgi:branched-chain amino acid transport system ATP-binding protein